MTLYNVMVSYKGEGSTNIFIPGIGDTPITNGRPIYLKNVGFNVIEALRQFRRMQIDLQINAKQEGAFRIIDMSEMVSPIRQMKPIEKVMETGVSQSDISNVLSSGSNGPIPTIEPIKEENKVDYGSFVITSGKFEGKTLAEVDKQGKLKAVYNGFKSRNKEIKEAIEKYYDSKISE